MSSLTTKVLVEIREEIKATKTELRAELRSTSDEIREEIKATRTELREEIRATNRRLDTHERLLVRLVDVAERHEHAIGKLVVGVDSLNTRFDNFLTGAHKVTHDEDRRRVDDLDARLTRLEARKPGGGGRRAG